MEVQSEVPVPVVYKGKPITSEGFRIDLLVQGEIIVELKSVETVQPVHKKQLLTYLRLAKKRLGLLTNFNSLALKDGVTRIINSSNEPGLVKRSFKR